jgi:retinoid hydroxylase
MPMTSTTQPNLNTLPLPPGSNGWPLIGHTLDFVRAPREFLNAQRQKFGDVFYVNLLGANTVYVFDPDVNGWIFQGENKYLQNKWNSNTRQLLGAQSVTMLVGEEHKTRRQQLMPHFKHSNMREFAPTIEAITERHLQAWAGLGGETVVFTQMRGLVFEVAVALIMGTDSDVDIRYLSKLFQTWTAGLFALPFKLPWTTFGKAVRAGEAMRAEIRRVVVARQQLAEQADDILGSLFSIRDEQGQPLSTEALVDEVQLLFFAGHDTTVTALSNLMLLLAQHPEVWAEARAEIDTAVSITQHTPLNLDELKQLPYLTNLINEGLRHITPIAGAFREMTEDVSFGGYRIPKGWVISLGIAGTHTDKNVWHDPDSFDPSRWAEPRHEQKNHKYNFIPFGGGPRVCLGQNFALAEMYVTLAVLLRDYTWELLPDQDLTMVRIPVPRPKSGIVVRFGKRVN